MRVRLLRDQLERIPDALIDVPPPEGSGGDEEGVVGSLLHSPDDNRLMADTGPLEVGDVEDTENREAGAFEPVFEWGAESDERMRRLGLEAGERIRRSVQVDSGSDALGHYLSFHVRGAQWGATVKASGIAYLATHVFSDLPTDDATRARLAFHAILQHELFHFATDVAVTQTELAQRQAWWRPAGDARRAQDVKYSHLEERLANTWMLRAFRTALPDFRVRGKQTALKLFVGRQPPGYHEALWPLPRGWDGALHDLMAEYAAWAGRQFDNPLLWNGGYDWSGHFPLRPRIDWRHCAIHYVDDSARYGIPPGWLTFLSALPGIVESERFRKQLEKLDSRHRERWYIAKERAVIGLTAGHDFKPWPKGGRDVWSMRIDRGFRAHLRRDRGAGAWEALEIGDHKTMGHG